MSFGTSDTPVAQAVEPAADYDRFVDWDRRLAREAPFFRREFEAHDVQRIVDVGSGSGRHALMWAEWGLDVTGVDPDASMLAQAAGNSAAVAERIAHAGGAVRFTTGGFGDLAGLGQRMVDAVTCTGNALPHVAGVSGLQAAVKDFAEVLRPGGLVVLHLLNHDRLLDQHIQAIPPVVRDGDDGRWVFIRLMEYVPEGIGFEFITLHRGTEEAEWSLSSRRSVHTALPSRTITETLAQAGFVEPRLFGNHDGKPFDAQSDESLLLVAVKA